MLLENNAPSLFCMASTERASFVIKEIPTLSLLVTAGPSHFATFNIPTVYWEIHTSSHLVAAGPSHFAILLGRQIKVMDNGHIGNDMIFVLEFVLTTIPAGYD